MFQTLSDNDSTYAALEIQCRAPYNAKMPLDSVSNTQLNSEKGCRSVGASRLIKWSTQKTDGKGIGPLEFGSE